VAEMSADSMNAWGDDITRRFKKYLDENPDVAERLFGEPLAAVTVREESDPTMGPGFDVVMADGRRVQFDVDAMPS
jgi:hypothetical protein